METIPNLFFFLSCLFFIVLAAHQIGQFFVRIKLPLITGFLFTGIIAGPFVFEFITIEAVKSLRFVDQFSLAVIAFSAGGELHLAELKNRFKSIKWTTIGLVLSTFTLGSLTVFLLAESIPFMQEISTENQAAISILAGAILVARSPSSAIAVIKELRAKGPFTQTALGVTVIIDAIVIILFAFNTSIADALITKVNFDFGFIFLLIIELVCSLVIGYCISKVLVAILSLRIKVGLKTLAILLTGYSVFLMSDAIRHATSQSFSSEMLVEPLLICMVSGFLVANHSKYREDFLRCLHKIAPYVYLIFFTFAGASLSLDILGQIWQVTLIIFAVRIVGLFLGSFVGGLLAREPLKYNMLSWMSYITQAGIGMGLAKEVAVQFPGWGTEFATLIISVIVINQIVGPSFFKLAIYLVNEAHPRAKKTEAGIVHNVIIFGSGGQAEALARQLLAHNWQVKIANTKKLEKVVGADIDVQLISEISLNELRFLGAGGAGAIVTMLSDEENFQICKIAHKHFSFANLVVQLNEISNQEQFKEFNAFTVASSTAMISLLDHFVRSPSAVSILLGMEGDKEIVEVEVHNPEVFGVPLKELRIPEDVLIISIYRSGQILNVHGDVSLQKGDLATILGPWESLKKIMPRFEAY